MNRRKAIIVKRTMGKMKLTLFLCTVMIFMVFSDSANHADAKVKLKAKIPALCYDCHEGLKKNLQDPHLHFLFKQGKCVTCHNTHVSKVEGLLHGETNSVCLNCHETLKNLIRNGIVHDAVRRGSCTDCHQAHSSRHDKLLKEQEKTLCVECHKEVQEKQAIFYACDAFKKGRCSACHDSHASLQNNLLRTKPNGLCKACHAPKCKAGNVSISSAVTNLDCTSCHSGHGSDKKGVLGPFGHTAFLSKNCGTCHDPIQTNTPITVKRESEQLCLDCHANSDVSYLYKRDTVHVRDVKNPCVICHNYHASDEKNLTKNEPLVCLGCHTKIEKLTLAMEKKLKTKECAPIRNRQCFECHIPMHSEQSLYFRDKIIPMCARCHTAEHSTTHPVGNNVIDPRNNKEVTCVSCHSMHSSRADYMLTHDRNRALCIQCHKI